LFVHFKERPDIDIFKAIFDDEPENDREMEIEVEDDNDPEIVLSSDEDVSVQLKDPNPVAIEKLPSSLSGIDLRKVNRYLNQNEEKEETQNQDQIFFVRPELNKGQNHAYGPSVPVLFPTATKKSTDPNKLSKLIKSVESSIKHKDRKRVSSSSPSSSSSTASSHSDEFVFVEKTLDKKSKKKSSKKRKKKNKKKSSKKKK
jgi:hypothetical protein